MARKRKSNSRKNRRLGDNRPATQASTALSVSDVSSRANEEISGNEESWYSEAWVGSRAGARASRGFHFQDAVGAWLASRIASEGLAIGSLTPEGLDDLQLDAPEPVLMQVKSRQERLGSFPVREAARHIVNSWLRHEKLFGADRRLVVVLEAGIVGWESATEHRTVEAPLTRLVGEVDGLANALSLHTSSRDGVSVNIDQLIETTSILACTWQGLTDEMESNISSVVNLPPAALTVIGRSLLSMVAAAVDNNAQPEFQNRISINRTRVIEEINSVAELIDLGAIDEAIIQGICGPLEMEPLEVGDAYYEGISTQPGHVTAGLVVPRPDVVSQVLIGLKDGEPILLVGPSGVGKSAVLWTVPSALPDVLWFRVHRLADDDVPRVVRMVKAYNPSSNSRVGLLVDGAGSADLGGWSRLRQSVASIQGIILVGTARNEDLFSMGSLAGCRTLGVSLEEAGAETIHAGLVRRGVTKAPHWREAFEQAQCLTLEFTHILTQGTRLKDVIRDQINSRVRECRSLELDIVTLVAVADRWSTSIPIGKLETYLGVGRLELRIALERLKSEHLLVEREGVISGLHQIRSNAIVDVVHSSPPPTLSETAITVLGMLSGSALSRFIYEVLKEIPVFEQPVLKELASQTQDDTDRLIACLRGLELLDFHRLASKWVEIAKSHDVPPAHLPLLFYFAITGVEVPEFFLLELKSAASEMADASPPGDARDRLLEEVGMERVAYTFGTMSSVDDCMRLLRTMSRTTLKKQPLLDQLKPGSKIVKTLESCSPKELGDCVEAAHDVSRDLALAFVQSVGSTDAVLQKFRRSDPWIQKLEVVTLDGDLVGVARILHISESDQGSMRDRANELGNQLLRALPDVDRVDVKGVLPGGQPLMIDGINYGSSGLHRQYTTDTHVVRRNQERIRIAHTLIGVSETERLGKAAKLILEVADLVRDFGNSFVRAEASNQDGQRLNERLTDLDMRGRQLPPPLGTFSLIEGESPQLIDGVSSLVIAVCSNVLPRLARPDQYMSLSEFITETVLAKDILAAKEQPWRFIGLEDYPTALDELAQWLSDINAVIKDLAGDKGSARRIIGEARRGGTKYALFRASKLARHRRNRRMEERRRAVTKELQSSRFNVEIHWTDGDQKDGKVANFAVAVTVETLFDWPSALEELLPNLEEVQNVGETPLIVPVLKGTSIPLFARQLISKLYPVDDLGDFAGALPQPIEERLTKYVISAHRSLEIMSGISILGKESESASPVNQLLEQARNYYSTAMRAICALGEDVVITCIAEWLTECEKCITDEREGETKAGTFATNLVEGVLGDGSQEIEELTLVLMLSLHWDSDRITAVTLLDSLAEPISSW